MNNVLPNNEEINDMKQEKKPSSWPMALASLGFSFTAYYLISIYSTLHWKVLSRNYENLDEKLKSSLGSLLSQLEFYRVFGFVALSFLALAFRGTPRWVAWCCVPFVLLAVLSSFSIM